MSEFRGMKKILKTLLIVLVLGVAFSQTLIETGYLRNPLGQPISNVYQMRFQIYQQPTGGASIWDSNYLSVSVNDGLYTVRLGSPGQPTLDQTIFSSAGDYYLGVEVDGDVFPDRELLSYHARAIQSDLALHSSTADISITSNYSLQSSTAAISISSNYSSLSSFSLTSDVALTSNYSLFSADSALFAGQVSGFYQDASNINSGTLAISRLSGVVVTDNYFGNVSVNGIVRATTFIGDGSLLTGMSGISGLNSADIVTRNFSSNLTINGSVVADQFIGVVVGTASYASTANYAITANYALESSGVRRNLSPIASTAYLAQNDTFPLVDASASDVTIYLPNPNTVSGREYLIKRVDASAHDVVILGATGELIEGFSSYRLTTKDEFVILTSDGSNWLISGNN